MKEFGYQWRTAPEKWEIDQVYQWTRLAWATDYVKKPKEYRNQIIFSDEFLIAGNPNKQTFWLPEGVEVPPTQRNH